MSESAAIIPSTAAETMLVVPGASLTLRALVPDHAPPSAVLPLVLPNGGAEAASSIAPSSLVVAITPHSVLVINNSNNEVVRSYDVSKSSDNEVKDALFVTSKRCFVVLTSDGTITVIPWECNDVKKLPKAALSQSKFSKIVIDEGDRVFGFTMDGRLCEINVAAGGAVVEEKSNKSSTKASSGGKADVAFACAISGVGVVSASGEPASATGTVSINVWSSTQSSATSRGVWLESESKTLALPNLSSKYMWTVTYLSSDLNEFGTAYALLNGSLQGSEVKGSKSKKSKVAETQPAPLDLPSHVFAIVKLDMENDEVLYARQLNCGDEIPSSVCLSGGFIWILYQCGLVLAWSKRFGVPATRSSNFAVPEPLTLRLSAPVNVSNASKKSKSSDAAPLLVGFYVSVAPEDDSAFYIYSATTNASNVSIAKELISVCDDSVEMSHSTAKTGSLASAIGALGATGSSIFAVPPPPVVSTSAPEDAEVSEEGSNSVLAGLPRRHKRKLAAAQAKYDVMMAQIGKGSSSSEDKTLQTQVSSNNASESSFFNRRPVINFKSEAVQDFLRRLQNSLTENTPLLRSDWAIVKLLASTGSLSMATYHALIENAMNAQRLDVLCDIAQHSPDLTEMQAVSIILFVLSCSDATILANNLNGGFLVFGQHERLNADDSAETASSSKSKKSKKAATTATSSVATTGSADPVQQRRVCVQAVMEALVHRKCAFTSATLVEAIRRGLKADVCMVLISVLWSMLKGFCSIHDVSVHIRELGDRQISLAIHWIEALLDSHFLDYAVTLSSVSKKSKANSDAPSHLVSGVVRMMGKSMTGLDAAQSELEHLYGLWTHVQRCSAAGLGDAHTGLGASGQASSNSLYQVETLVL